MKILLGILSILTCFSFLGMVCDGDKTVKRYMLMSFVICILALMILVLLG